MTGDFVTSPFLIYLGAERFCVKFKFTCKGLNYSIGEMLRHPLTCMYAQLSTFACELCAP